MKPVDIAEMQDENDRLKARIVELETHIKMLERNIIELRTINNMDNVPEVPFMFKHEEEVK